MLVVAEFVFLLLKGAFYRLLEGHGGRGFRCGAGLRFLPFFDRVAAFRYGLAQVARFGAGFG
ncbi:MAG: hypothetical protein CL814_02295 [Confluentimicrobium sp.]|nr:hypothetical protein [Actibacterium sp.]